MQGTSFIECGSVEDLDDLQTAFVDAHKLLQKLRAGKLEFDNARARRDTGARRGAIDERKNRDVEVAIIRLETMMEEITAANGFLNSALVLVRWNIQQGDRFPTRRLELVAKNNFVVARELCEEIATFLHELRLQVVLPETSRRGFEAIDRIYAAPHDAGRHFALVNDARPVFCPEPVSGPYLTYQEARTYALQGIGPDGQRQKSRVLNVLTNKYCPL